MIKALSIVIATALATPDGGVQYAPLVDRDAGVVQVESAIACQAVTGAPDGGWTCEGGDLTLPAGWWVSPDRMKRIGDNVAQCKADKEACAIEARAAGPSMKVYLVLFGLGFLSGSATILYVMDKVR